jgi:hypothetical protein
MTSAHVEETGVFRACAARENPCGTKRQQTSPLPLGKTLGQTGLTLGRIRVPAQCLLARQYHLEAGAQTNASMPYRCPREGGLVKSPSPGPHRIIFDGCTRGIYPQWAGTQPLACVFFQYGLCRPFLYNCDDRRFSRPENDAHFPPYLGCGYGYVKATGRLGNQGRGGHAFSRAAARRSGW